MRVVMKHYDGVDAYVDIAVSCFADISCENLSSKTALSLRTPTAVKYTN
jgi:hypothetical protein